MEYTLSICNALHDDHMITVSALERLESALTKTGRKVPPAADDPEWARLLADLVAIMRSEISSHFSFEEKYLFPLAEEIGDSPMIMILQDEHDTIRPLAERFARAVDETKGVGFGSESWPEFFDLSMELAERETFHIQKEEMAFLPMLDQIIDPEIEPDLTMALADGRRSF